MDANNILTDLIKLSHELGREERMLAILGEGNTSADCGDGTFWVKASGSQLNNIDETGFSRARMEAVLDLMSHTSLSDEQIATGLQESLVDKKQKKPSVETFLHALCIKEAGAHWVAHTHPVSVNSILCSKLGAEPFLHHLFPDQIVVCGKAPVVVPYVDPGSPLATAVRDELRRYQDQHGTNPKVLLMINHGLVALGQNAREALNISLMADKWAKIIQGAYIFGGLNSLTQKIVERIDNRPDELYRRKQLGA